MEREDHNAIELCRDNIHMLNDWEVDFIGSIEGKHTLSPKMREKLREIVHKIEKDWTPRWTKR